MTFDALGAMRKLRDRGAEEPLAEGIVEVVTDARSELLTREYFDQMRVADRQYLDAQRAADRESLNAQRVADRESLNAQRVADRESLNAQRLADREYLDMRFGAERHYFDARFEGFRAEMYRALAIQGGVILAGVGVIVAMVETLA